MSELLGAKIHITGIVQGVGFRPFVFGSAVRLGLTGWVRNSSAGVDIQVDGTRDRLDEFVSVIKSELPPLARIDTIEVSYGIPGRFTGFDIIQSKEVEGAFQPISPDVCMCEDCMRELFDPGDRRYRYPFINCTNCGPRFTIITGIPYDRPNTTMSLFRMCPDCRAEYQNPLDRRFHAQPIACPKCGPKIWLEGKKESHGQILEGDDAIYGAQKMLSEGKILAIKGLGGFHLACDATNAKAVIELRNRKLRVDKPYALMMADMSTIDRFCEINSSEREHLKSRQRPIVLLKKRRDSMIADEVAPKQETLGVMLPYTPLHTLLLHESKLTPTVLVMTSGNLSEEPIVTGNIEAQEHLSSLADGFLMNNRDIHVRCDDTVVRSFKEKTYFLRRSRGYAPDSIQLPYKIPPILACGPELKNTFCHARGSYGFVSQHIGDMENYETLRSFGEGILHFERLFRIQPEAIAYDTHPNYLSTRYALERAKTMNIPAIGVQHHHAHIAACMGDNGVDGTRPVIGVAFDGTGYGDDGTIWGGEFIVANYAGYERKYHLATFPLPGGDAAIKHPARTALALLWSQGFDWDEELFPVRDISFEERTALHTQLERDLNAPKTSSMGRLFDAAAAIAGVRQKVNYEAQAAIEFESALDNTETGVYRFEIQNQTVNARPVFEALLRDIHKGVKIPVLSARFHNGIANMVMQTCGHIRNETGLNDIVLSGGVWQNMALLERAVKGLQTEGFKVHIHHQIPPNDGGISLGQILVGASKFVSSR